MIAHNNVLVRDASPDATCAPQPDRQAKSMSRIKRCTWAQSSGLDALYHDTELGIVSREPLVNPSLRGTKCAQSASRGRPTKQSPADRSKSQKDRFARALKDGAAILKKYP